MKKKYKILLSAYACEPNVGSEPGVGWNWAIEIKKLGHEILIITRKNNKKVIEKELLTNKILNKKNFYYFDLPKFFKVLSMTCWSFKLRPLTHIASKILSI